MDSDVAETIVAAWAVIAAVGLLTMSTCAGCGDPSTEEKVAQLAAQCTQEQRQEAERYASAPKKGEYKWTKTADHLLVGLSLYCHGEGK